MGGFDVVILGFKLNGSESPARVLERVLGESPARAKELTRGFPARVREDVPAPAAEEIATALRGAGARVEVRAHAAAPSATAAPAPVESKGSADGYKLGTLRIALPAAPAAPAVPLALAAPARSVAAHLEQGAPGVPGNDASHAGADLPAVQASAASLGSAAPRRTTGQFLLGTLRIILPGGPPKPAAGVAPTPPAPAVASAPLAPMAPSEVGVLDDTFEPVGHEVPLELDADALADRSMQVSGGRALHRPSLMMRVRESLVDVPMKVVRRARAPAPVPEGLGRVRSVPLLFLSLLATGAVAALSGGYWALTRGAELGEAVAAHAASVEGESGETERAAGMTDAQGEAPKHPLLKLAPKPMEATLASILRRQVPGVHNVSIDWGEQGPPEGRLQCMLVSGSSALRNERVQALLATGTRVEITPFLENQMRDHAESLRAAENDAKARFTSLCLTN